MTKRFKPALLASVSAAAITLMAASPASAFDRVNWTWDAQVLETVTKTINIDADLVPTGMVMMEDLQVYIGNVSANSLVVGVANNQPEGGGLVDLGTRDIQFHYGLGGGQLDDGFATPGVTNGLVDETDQEPDINGTVTATIDLGEVEVPPTESFDAVTELPEVVSAATAVANSTSITSDTMVELHEGQFTFNVRDELGRDAAFALLAANSSDNSNLTAAGVLGVLAITGNLAPSQIEANSGVLGILNASVDSSATAVANNLSVSIEPKTDGDAVLLADVVQFAYANTTANSAVALVGLNSYTNLGLLDRPIVSSVATAVGNNKSISVVTPVIASP